MAAGERAQAAAAEHPERVLAQISGARTGAIFDELPDRAILVLLEHLHRSELTNTPLKGARGTLGVTVFRRLGPPDPTPPRLTHPPDARNLVALLGDRDVLKLFRRLDPGPHPEVTLRQHVTGPGGFGRVPRVTASIVYRPASGDPVTLGVIDEQLLHQRNGWDHAVADVERYLIRAAAETGPPPDDEVRPIAGPDHTEVPERVRAAIGGYLETMALIGRRVAELHLALAAPGRDFGLLQGLGPEYFVDVVAAIEAQATVIRGLADEVLPRLPDSLADALRRLIDPATSLQSNLAVLSARAAPDTPMMRVHNDLNLGQILLQQGDALFVDFEGDPDRPASWRLRRHSPLRDLATLVHSIHYAAHAGLRRHVATRPQDAERLGPWVDSWRQWLSAVFLESYQAGVAGTALATEEAVLRQAGLDLLVVDQALQDLEMEMRSRPDWIGVPLDTLMRICGPMV